MAPISPGNMSGPPRKPKKPTATTKAHRYEGFSKRIAKIKIDPVHTVQKTRVTEDQNDLSQSYFRTALDEWAELNLSATFTSFLNKASPLSESLPQLLHHADKVFALLLEHIKREDTLALEPLLSLVAHLAHDLGTAFEKYFASVVNLVARVSTTVDDPAAIESCFTCLAWTFKYLSRLLVQDLRPLLEIMIPYMFSKQEYVRKFTAESLAFLLRKAAIMYGKNQLPLRLAITYLFDQLQERRDTETNFYAKALMTLLSESAMGVDVQLHSCVTDLFNCVFEIVGKTSNQNQQALKTVDGTVINLIHRTNARGFEPLEKIIAEIAKDLRQDDTNHTSMVVRLLFDISATRRGSRVSDWQSMTVALLVHLRALKDPEELDQSHVRNLLGVATACIQYSPMDQLLPHAKEMLDTITTVLTLSQFLAFCEMTAELGTQRFQDLVLPRLQQYILLHWEKGEDGLCYLLQQLRNSSTISSKPGDTAHLTCPKEWERSIVRKLIDSSYSDGFPERYSKYFRLHRTLHYPRSDDAQSSLCSVIASSLNSVFQEHQTQFSMSARLTAGWAFNQYVNLSQAMSDGRWPELVKQMVTRRPEYYQLMPFLESCLVVLKSSGTEFSNQKFGKIETALCDNMLSDSLELRNKSLQILATLGDLQKNVWLTSTTEVLLEVINIQYMPSNAREIAALVRRLPKQHEQCDKSSYLMRLIPLFTLGMLRHYHDQNRRDLCVALRDMAAGGDTEDVIISIAAQWLQEPGIPKSSIGRAPDEATPAKLTFFECSNLLTIRGMADDVLERHANAGTNLEDEFHQAHLLRSPKTPIDSRLLALQLFLSMPDVAERRSRILSPVFLSIQQGKTNHHVPPSDESASSHTISPDYGDRQWSLHERKLFLELMSKYVNPKVLYRANEIYESLLELLANGNADVRKLALLGLFNWKDKSLSSYKDMLLRVAEEKNATTELMQLLSTSDEDASIKPQDRKEVLPFLLRLIFGQLIGRTGTHGSQEAKRKSLLRLLFRMEEHEVNIFLSIALGRLGDVSLRDDGALSGESLNIDILSQDQQYGFLRMILSIQGILQSQFGPYGKKIVDAILYCTARACRQTNHLTGDTNGSAETSLTKNIRRSGVQCLTAIFENSQDIDWNSYSSTIFDEVVGPRLPNFAVEVAQGVSGLLHMFSIWCKFPRLFPLLKLDQRLTDNLWKILAVPSAREDVKLFVLEQILTPLLENSATTGDSAIPANEILTSEIELIFTALTGTLSQRPSKHIMLSIAKVIPLLAPYAKSSKSSDDVLNLLITLLCEPAQRMPPHIKGQLLSATESLLKIRNQAISHEVETKLYNTISAFFNYFKDQPNRATLGRLLAILVRDDSELLETVRICEDLNAVSEKHLGGSDYDRQLIAYDEVNSLEIVGRSSKQWSPILNNLLFFARTADEFAIRSNAVMSLKRFILRACETTNYEVQGVIGDQLLPAFKKGVREGSELVRADFVVMFGLVVQHLSSGPDLEDMKVLLVGGDEEASFFTNILHIQQHRRLRAIRRLLTEVERGLIKSSNIAGFFLPLLEKFTDDEGGDESMQGVKGQSIAAMSVLLQWLDWKTFRATLRQYKSDLDTGARSEKDAIKLLANAVDALESALKHNEDSVMDTGAGQHLKSTLPEMETIAKELKTNFIPKLSKFIHHKDEAEISLRIPAAKVAVKLIKLLPPEELSSLVTPIILDISQILRSRAQESRDVARNTLAEIVVLLGPSSIQFVLREMRSTLTRGYQLHVLSFTLHTILLQSVPDQMPGDLDYCLEDLVSVVMDDIFGVVGQEKENQDYISSMREVKASKSQDSMEILAKSASVHSMSKLVAPFHTLLRGDLTTRQVRQVDELFRRIGVGISHNPAASSRDLLVFAYELIQEFYKNKVLPQERILTNDEKNRQRFLIQLKSKRETTATTSSSLLYKIARFALDLVRSTLVKHTSLMTSENVHGFIPVIGDALIEAQEDVKVSALRLLSAIIKLPLSELDQNASLYVMEAVKVVRSSISTSEEFPQAALKLVAAILRERTHVEVRDSDIAYLLHRTVPDIEEPDRQGVAFNFIKAVMARRYQLPEVYELMDKVAFMMVTNQTRSARDVARGVYIHFLLEYPQSTSRWTKQMKFLVKNLEYETREGRQAVMEAIHLLLHKLKGDILQETISLFFVPVVLRMANDADPECCKMATALLSQLYLKADLSQLAKLLDPLRGWLGQNDNLSLIKLSLQAWEVYFDLALDGAEAEILNARGAAARIIQNHESDQEQDLLLQALKLYHKLASACPTMIMIQSQASVWTKIWTFLLPQYEVVQYTAAKLLSCFFQDCISKGTPLGLPLTSGSGLKVDHSTIVNLLRNLLRALKRNESSDGLAQQIVQNLMFLGRYIETKDVSCQIKARPVTNGAAAQPEDASDTDPETDNSSTSDVEVKKSIPAIQYLLDQLTSILRREPGRLTTTAFTPRMSALHLLNNLIPQLSTITSPTTTTDTTLPESSLINLLTPLTYITDPSLPQPRSADPTFPETYQNYIESAHALQETIQKKVGDSEYVRLVTEVSRLVREKRGERKMKRAFDRVADPERAEREKRRKKAIKERRKKSVVDIHRRKRRGDLGF